MAVTSHIGLHSLLSQALRCQRCVKEDCLLHLYYALLRGPQAGQPKFQSVSIFVYSLLPSRGLWHKPNGGWVRRQFGGVDM